MVFTFLRFRKICSSRVARVFPDIVLIVTVILYTVQTARLYNGCTTIDKTATNGGGEVTGCGYPKMLYNDNQPGNLSACNLTQIGQQPVPGQPISRCRYAWEPGIMCNISDSSWAPCTRISPRLSQIACSKPIKNVGCYNRNDVFEIRLRQANLAHLITVYGVLAVKPTLYAIFGKTGRAWREIPIVRAFLSELPPAIAPLLLDVFVISLPKSLLLIAIQLGKTVHLECGRADYSCDPVIPNVATALLCYCDTSDNRSIDQVGDSTWAILGFSLFTILYSIWSFSKKRCCVSKSIGGEAPVQAMTMQSSGSLRSDDDDMRIQLPNNRSTQ